jgi:hypothetical protein
VSFLKGLGLRQPRPLLRPVRMFWTHPGEKAGRDKAAETRIAVSAAAVALMLTGIAVWQRRLSVINADRAAQNKKYRPSRATLRLKWKSLPKRQASSNSQRSGCPCVRRQERKLAFSDPGMPAWCEAVQKRPHDSLALGNRKF